MDSAVEFGSKVFCASSQVVATVLRKAAFAGSEVYVNGSLTTFIAWYSIARKRSLHGYRNWTTRYDTMGNDGVVRSYKGDSLK